MLTATIWIAIGAIAAALITREIKISEFRQAWINELREDISAYVCKAHQWIDLYLLKNQESNQENKSNTVADLDRLKYDALHIHSRICLRFKPDDTVANNLLSNLLNLLDPSKTGLDSNAYSNWRDLSNKVVLEARVLLKEEWEATKNPFLRLCKKLCKKCLKSHE